MPKAIPMRAKKSADFSLGKNGDECDVLRRILSGLRGGAEKALVEDCLSKEKLLGATCDASAFSGTIGALNDVRHTGNDLDDLKKWAGEG